LEHLALEHLGTLNSINMQYYVSQTASTIRLSSNFYVQSISVEFIRRCTKNGMLTVDGLQEMMASCPGNVGRSQGGVERDRTDGKGRRWCLSQRSTKIRRTKSSRRLPGQIKNIRINVSWYLGQDPHYTHRSHNVIHSARASSELGITWGFTYKTGFLEC
jgi:hypothetical protein